ncbi:hypothetical protein ACJIZ3_003102 [Penstemon smallii]|uniref:AP2/ERF domain-containing protein n=1 Tax=Penstemon smallii TaxID=265156 RepID=A0ABD3U894_9LAMI
MNQDCNIECSTKQYIGVRKRKWGKWVSEIRQPGTKTRIWLGSYEAPEMAAAAYDVAALHLKGPNTRLNFPELVDGLPKPVSSNAMDVQSAAQEAAMRLRRTAPQAKEGGHNIIPVRVGLSASQIQAINESPLDSPKMWTEIATGDSLLGEVVVSCGGIEIDEWDEMDYYSIWD